MAKRVFKIALRRPVASLTLSVFLLLMVHSIFGAIEFYLNAAYTSGTVSSVTKQEYFDGDEWRSTRSAAVKYTSTGEAPRTIRVDGSNLLENGMKYRAGDSVELVYDRRSPAIAYEDSPLVPWRTFIANALVVLFTYAWLITKSREDDQRELMQSVLKR